MASYQQSPQDEGYSEDPLTGSTVSNSIPPWLSSMTTSERNGRIEYVMNIISQLQTSEVAEIVRRLRPRLYINFFNYLPPEVCLKILGFLDPDSLIKTAQASKEWMELALDRRLWKQLYLLDGFRVNNYEVLRFEDSLNADRNRPSGSNQSDEHVRKRRATPQRMISSMTGDGDSEMPDAPFYKQSSIFGSVTGTRLTKEPSHDPDVTMASPKSPTNSQIFKPSNRHSRLTAYRYSNTSPEQLLSRATALFSLATLDLNNNKRKINWHYLYSQRRRLEANWENEKYTNFQLPHPNHPEEAHEECIYTIQHSGRYLVSGSRDRSLRIWDLDTQRLIRPPLRAHQGSVLCLQFDADPEEDLIVSGSSDATVILWRFSTGQIIQRLRKAHGESVLNVRFDKRVLVTCSKDKTIKIFNRRAMKPGDLGYPYLHDGVAPVPTFLNNYGFNPSPTAGLPIKQPYSMIGCLEGHGAAVNAVQIYRNEIVSASGDRTVKVWDWTRGTCDRTLIGHSKGIACVQYDGRRIVSGSSDNEVKVFDKVTGLEVASLRAHKNLVRTVQAGFGDLPYSAEEDQADARMIDNEYFKAVDAGVVPMEGLPLRGRLRNAGSRKPEDITAYGATLPPGGGGGRFGRIVSGSYDETIIIWRRDKEGVWKAQHTLRQEEAAIIASRPVQDTILQHISQTIEQDQAGPSTPPQQPESQASDVDAPSSPFAPGGNAWYRHLVHITMPGGPSALRDVLQVHPQLLTRAELADAIQDLPQPEQSAMRAVVNAAIQIQQQLLTVGAPTFGPGQQAQPSVVGSNVLNNTTTSTTTTTANSTSATLMPQQSTTQSTANINPSATAVAATVAAAIAAPPVIIPAPQTVPHHVQSNMARVFKLQFDARRIICCSQTSVIVGWDFANGDAQLIEASRFFAPIE